MAHDLHTVDGKAYCFTKFAAKQHTQIYISTYPLHTAVSLFLMYGLLWCVLLLNSIDDRWFDEINGSVEMGNATKIRHISKLWKHQSALVGCTRVQKMQVTISFCQPLCCADGLKTQLAQECNVHPQIQHIACNNHFLQVLYMHTLQFTLE